MRSAAIHLAVLLMLLCAHPGVWAEAAPSGSAVAAARMVALFDKEGGAAVLRPFQVKSPPPPWVVALRLVSLGRRDVAEALAAASPHADFEGLEERIPAWSKTPPTPAALAALTILEQRAAAGDWAALRASRATIPADAPAFLRGYEAYLRGRAHLKALFASEAKDEKASDAVVQDVHRLMGAAVRHARATGTLSYRGDAYAGLGHAQARLLDFEGALESWTAAAAVMDRRGQRWPAAVQYINLGVVAMRRSANRRALQALGEAMTRLRVGARVAAPTAAVGWNERRVTVARLQAVSHGALGSYAAALSRLDTGRDIAVSVYKTLTAAKDTKRLRAVQELFADLHITRSDVLRAVGDNVAARASAEKAEGIFRALGVWDGVGRAVGQQGLVDLDEGQLDAAIAKFEAARQRFVSLKLTDQATRALNNASIGHLRAGRIDEARDGFRTALATFKRDQDLPAELDARFHLAEIDRLQGRLERARTKLLEIKRIAAEAHLPEPQMDALIGLGKAEFVRGNFAAAMAACDEGIVIMARGLRHLGHDHGVMARAPRSEVFEIGAACAARLEGHASKFSRYVEAGRAGSLLEAMGLREQLRTESVPADLRAREDAARLRVAGARARFADAHRRRDLPAMRTYDREIEAAQAAVRAAIRAIQRGESSAAAADLIYPEPDDLDSIRATLAVGDALVQYASIHDEAYALVATRRRARVMKLGPGAEIEKASALVAEGLGDKAVDSAGALKRLRQLLIDPLQLKKHVKRLLIVPAGNLYRIPLQVVAPEFETTYVPSGTTIKRLGALRRARGEGVLALGDPVYATKRSPRPGAQRGRELAPLPGSRAEVEAIGTRKLLGEGATEAALREALAAHSKTAWRAIHFACHGLIDMDQPMHSALAITVGDPGTPSDDGFLTADEVRRLPMRSDLTVLSACDSGRGKVYRGEGLLGLTRAFMLAGAPRLMVSLWKVDDEATQALMREFYRVWNPKDPKQAVRASTALRVAQAHVRKEAKWAHPYYWAAWVLWGLPE